MPIVASDLVLRLSTTAGAAGDSTAGTGSGSLGKYVSTTVAPSTTAGVFDDVSGDENASSVVDYRCVFVLNNHASLTLTNAAVYLSAEVAGGASIAIAVDNIGPVAKGSGSAQAAQVASETTAPSGVSAFSSPTTRAGGIALGNIGPGQVRAVWLRRTAANSAAIDADGVTIAVAGDTAA